MSEENREKWSSNYSFLLAMIGSAVGLGNIWRYPYVAYSNGGGAFMVPYILSILFFGIPLLFLEYGSGYNFKAGVGKIFHKINTKYEYFGWLMQVVPFLIVSYYICIVAWDLVYIPLSFVKGWGTNPESFFNTVILQNTTDISGLLGFSIYILVALIVLWLILWFISSRNLNDGVGRINKLLTPMIFIIMFIIVVSAISLEGSYIGINTLFKPDFSLFFDVSIWLAAFGQILFSLSIGATVTIAYTSYLPDDVDIPKNVLTVAIANCGFEVFTAVGVFSILGYMSATSGVAIGELVTQGSQLAFIVFPQIFNIMGFIGYVLGPLFFLCLLFAGITSVISLLEPIILSLQEKFDLTRLKAVSIMCLCTGLLSLLFATHYGPTLIDIFDLFANNFAQVLNVLIETIIIGIVYGADKLIPGINENATFFKVGRRWKLLITILIPVIGFLLWIGGIIDNMAGDTTTHVIQFLLLLLMLVVPYILTKLPSRSDDF